MPDAILVPVLLCARIATMARVDGRLSGLRADVVHAAQLSLPSRPGLLAAPLALESLDFLSDALAALFSRALRFHMDTSHPDAFSLHMRRVDKGMHAFASGGSPTRALPIFLCANPDDCVWELPSVDDRHGSFGSPSQSRLAMEGALASSIHSIAPAAESLGLRLLPCPRLHIESEARFDSAPRMPTIPLTSIHEPHWGQTRALWTPLVELLHSAIEADQLERAVLAPAAPSRRARRAL